MVAPTGTDRGAAALSGQAHSDRLMATATRLSAPGWRSTTPNRRRLAGWRRSRRHKLIN